MPSSGPSDTSLATLKGRLALVTGTDAGIGRETARALAAAGAEVVACPCDSSDDAFGFDPLDTASIDRLADRVLALGRPVDLVIAAAEIAGVPHALTRDGVESQMAYNAVANAVLASRLSPAIRAAEAGRFVILSSSRHHFAAPDPDDLAFSGRAYHPWLAYGASKTAAGLIALKVFDELFDDAYSTCAVHPGALLGASDEASIRESEGVATLLWAAASPETFARYSYAEHSGPSHMVLRPDGVSGYMPHIGDVALANRLWAAIERHLGRPLPFDR